MITYNWRTAPVELISSAGVRTRPPGTRSGNKRLYMDIVTAFDIETTTVCDDYAVMYIWQMQLGLNATVTGRSWKEFTQLLLRIRKEIHEGAYLVCYVHNLSFEFQFLRGIYHFQPDEVFAVEPRKPLRCDMYGCIEFRCSYLHSNMRLETYLEKMGVEHLKEKGFDYSKSRYPWTPLTDQELLYCINDVRGLVEAITVEMLHDGDDLYTIPATSTGYVRRDVKRAMRKLVYGYVKDQLPDIEIFHLLREAFRGGNTHANRYFAGQIVEGVRSYDRSSSYPDVMVNCEYPVTRFHLRRSETTLTQLSELINRRHKACLIRIALSGVELRDPMYGAPYLPVDKCRKLSGEAVDNGRVLSCDYAETTFTDIDWKIFISQYKFQACRILTCAYARYGRLPKVVQQQVIYYYKRKTELKDVDGQELFYEKSKQLLNSIYGMAATNPCKIVTVFTGRDWDYDHETTLEEILAKSNRRAFFPYQWGVWTTAWARYRLEEGIRLASAGAHYSPTDPRYSDFIYCDTDSVKYIGNVDWDPYNLKRMEASIDSDAFADDPKCVRHYMGVYEPDKGYPARFATRGAKKYVVEHPDGKLEATISGVSKRSDETHVSGGDELAKHGGLEAFLQPEFTFVEAGGTQLVYNDRDRFLTRIDGHRLKVRECVCIKPDVYTLHDREDYADLLSDSRVFRDFMLDIEGKKV